MLKSELEQIIANGENSGVEFKRDDCRPEQLAREIVAMVNLNGGIVLLGVEDDGTISGIQRKNLEEWVMDSVVARKIHPLILPFYEEIQIDDQERVAVISFTQGVAKPYVLRHNNREDIYIRVGSTSRLATREQQARLFASGGLLHTELLPVSGTTIDSLDLDRIEDYLRNVVEDPEIPSTDLAWEKRLCNLGFMSDVREIRPVCSIAGLMLFGYLPRQFLRQAGLRLMVFAGPDKDYQAQLDEILDGPMVGRWKKPGNEVRRLITPGVIEDFLRIIRPYISEETGVIEDQLRRDRIWHYPVEAVREVIVNALAHRDWTRSIDIEVSVYSDRLEVISPGALQNSMTVEKMIAGQRAPRNPLVVEVLKDYGYVDARGMGIRTKVIPLMRRQNRTEPLFEATDDFLKTTLFRGPIHKK
ncbi:MAG: RNA-binding domain-containing protein [Desulfomonilaceae bacterium]